MENLSYNNRLRQLRILAEAALTYYDIGSARLALLTHRSNTMFRVTAGRRPGSIPDDGARTGETRYALRLSNPRTTGARELHSELLWLSALRQDTDLVVPEPIHARDGSLVTEITVEDIPEMRRCVLFRWVEGRFIDSSLSPTLFERVGNFMARLHRYSRSFVPPENFVRPRWDWNWLLQGPQTVFDPTFVATRCDGLITPHEQRILDAAAARIRMEMQAIPPNAQNYGLIHFDLQQSNYLFYKGDVHAIDFDDCCWNYYLFDMAITLSGVAGRPDEAALRKAFFRGYTQIQPLPSDYEAQLNVFTALRIIKRISYLFRSQTPQIRAQAPAWLEYAIPWLDQFASLNVDEHKTTRSTIG